MLYNVILTFESVDKILKHDHSVLSCGTVYCDDRQGSGAVYYAVHASWFQRLSLWTKS